MYRKVVLTPRSKVQLISACHETRTIGCPVNISDHARQGYVTSRSTSKIFEVLPFNAGRTNQRYVSPMRIVRVAGSAGSAELPQSNFGQVRESCSGPRSACHPKGPKQRCRNLWSPTPPPLLWPKHKRSARRPARSLG